MIQKQFFQQNYALTQLLVFTHNIFQNKIQNMVEQWFYNKYDFHNKIEVEMWFNNKYGTYSAKLMTKINDHLLRPSYFYSNTMENTYTCTAKWLMKETYSVSDQAHHADQTENTDHKGNGILTTWGKMATQLILHVTAIAGYRITVISAL
jgi:hypothetical protein